MTEVEVVRCEGLGPRSRPRGSPALSAFRDTRAGRGAPDTCCWRGYGGGIPTIQNVEFDRQMDRILLWMEQWDHKQRCNLLEVLIACCKLQQFRLLWTVLQPALHRDFMYTARKHYPNMTFVPISSHASRELKKKNVLMRTDNYHRIESAHLQHQEQIQEVMSEVRLPDINSPQCLVTELKAEERKDEISLTGSEGKVTQSWPGEFRTKPRITRAHTVQGIHSLPGLSDMHTCGAVTPVRSHTVVGLHPMHLDGQNNNLLYLLQTAPPKKRNIEMPVRRHIQEEWVLRTYPNTGTRTELMMSNMGDHQSLGVNKDGVVKYKHPPEVVQVMQWFQEQWTDIQRNEFFHKFLLKLDSRQHYFISSLLAVKQHRDFLAQLPTHIALHILSFLSTRKIVTISRVSKTWYQLCNNNELWRMKCQEIQIEIPVVDETTNWKTVFRENRHIKRNWRSGKCKTLDLKGHTDKVLTLTFDATRLATGSADRTIRLWALKDGRPLMTLKGHLKGIWCLQFFTKSLLISGSYDCTIKIWNLREANCSRTLLGHEGPVWAIARRGNILVSASQDRMAKIWDISRCVLMHTLKGHNAAVFAVDMDEDATLVITGSADRSVRLWDAESGRQRKVLWVSQTTSVMSVSFSRGHLACSYGNTILIYRLDLDGTSSRSRRAEPSVTCKLVKTYEEHQKRIETIELRLKEGTRPRGMLISAGKDGTIKYWDITRDRSIQTFTGHHRSVNCIHCDHTRLISASYDNKVKIWDFSVI